MVWIPILKRRISAVRRKTISKEIEIPILENLEKKHCRWLNVWIKQPIFPLLNLDYFSLSSYFVICFLNWTIFHSLEILAIKVCFDIRRIFISNLIGNCRLLDFWIIAFKHYLFCLNFEQTSPLKKTKQN